MRQLSHFDHLLDLRTDTGLKAVFYGGSQAFNSEQSITLSILAYRAFTIKDRLMDLDNPVVPKNVTYLLFCLQMTFFSQNGILVFTLELKIELLNQIYDLVHLTILV